MPAQILDQLQRTYEQIPNIQFLQHASEFINAELRWQKASCKISLYGGQVLSYSLPENGELLWLSPTASFQYGKAIRGGIPVCWPWFGPAESDLTKTMNSPLPDHGRARINYWRVSKCSYDYASGVSLELSLYLEDLQLEAVQTIKLSDCLQITLESRNLGSKAFALSQALHSYFNVGDISKVEVYGLENTTYIDKTRSSERFVQENPIIIDREIDRAFINTDRDCLIKDESLQRRIRISKSNSSSTVVWNPWIEKSMQLADMPDESYRHMLCVESGNLAENTIKLQPDSNHVLSCKFALEK